MRHEWEKKIKQSLLAEIDAMLPDGIVLIGLAVESIEDGGGALIVEKSAYNGSVTTADAFQDILGDATRKYGVAVRSMYGAFTDNGDSADG